MSVERKLQLNLVVLAALGTMLLGMAQASFVLPALAVITTFVAWYLTDLRKVFCLPRTAINVVALAAFAVVLLGLFRLSPPEWLPAIANVLICLQMILFFSDKSSRTYGLLAMLSLVQVIVSAALNVGFEFWMLIALYTVVATSFMTLLFVFRTMERTAPTPSLPPAPAESGAVSARSLRAIFGSAPVAEFTGDRQSLGSQLSGWRLTRQIVALALVSLVFSVVMFFTAPRPSKTASSLVSQQSVTSMPMRRVSLDEVAAVYVSAQPVMRVRFFDETTQEPYRIAEAPYFRGAVFQKYVADEARWVPPINGGMAQIQSPPRDERLVRVKLAIEPTREFVVCSTFPIYELQSKTAQVAYNVGSKRLVFTAAGRQPLQSQSHEIEYLTTAFDNSRQLPVAPVESTTFRSNQWQRTGTFDNVADTLQIERQRFPRLIALADEVAAESETNDRVSVARALERHFRDSNRYSYTLDFSEVRRTPGVDPIEDFVSNHRRGHCEYFASALTQALRSQGIPARLITGYRGGEYNALGKHFQVRQLHAHAWVEAYLRPEDITAGMLPDGEVNRGGWLRLDATPESSLQEFYNEGGVFDQATDLVDFARVVWNDYVVNLDRDRQSQTIYDPLSRGAEFLTLENLTRWLAATGIFGNSSTAFPSDSQSSPWQGAAVLIALVAGMLVLWYVLRRWRWSFSIFRRRSGASAAIRSLGAVEFYNNLLAMLARHGMHKAPPQTPREFAGVVGGEMSESPNLRSLAGLPRRIVDAFYDVRFGGATLDPRQHAEVEQALAQLAAALDAARHNRLHSTDLEQQLD